MKNKDQRKPLEVFEWALSLQKNLDAKKVKSAEDKSELKDEITKKALEENKRPTTATSVIHFQSDEEDADEPAIPEGAKVYRNFHQIDDAVKFEVTRNETMLQDIMKRIWGEKFPETFLTEVLEEPDLSSSRIARTNRSHEETPEPARRVQEQEVPLELPKRRCALPVGVHLPSVLDRVKPQKDDEDTVLTIRSNIGNRIIQDGFWWIFLDEFRRNQPTQQSVFDRMCEEFVKLSIGVFSRGNSDALHNYHDRLSQCLLYSFRMQYTDSKRVFDDGFKMRLLTITAEWTLGMAPRNLTFSHWTPQIQVESKSDPSDRLPPILNTREIQKEPSERYSLSSVPIIPVKIKKEVIRIRNSGFVIRFLEIRGVKNTSIKYQFKATFTQADRITVEDLNECQQERLEEARKLTCKSIKAKNKLDNLREEIQTLVTDQNESRKDYMKLLECEHADAKYNSKAAVQSILSEMGFKSTVTE